MAIRCACRRLIRRVLVGVADHVNRDDLFEKPGERAASVRPPAPTEP